MKIWQAFGSNHSSQMEIVKGNVKKINALVRGVNKQYPKFLKYFQTEYGEEDYETPTKEEFLAALKLIKEAAKEKGEIYPSEDSEHPNLWLIWEWMPRGTIKVVKADEIQGDFEWQVIFV